MRQSLLIPTIVCGAVWLSAAVAQRPLGSTSLAGSRTGSTVSPYLNLGVNSNGLSNYSSLVRPLLNQRERLARQTLTRQRLSASPRNLRDGHLARDAPPEEETGPRVSGRFMNYSHYFGRRTR